MLRWYWYLCGAVYVKQSALLSRRELEDHEAWRTKLLATDPADLYTISPGVRGRPRADHLYPSQYIWRL